MGQIELLTKQTSDAYAWINKVIDKIPHDKWDEIPDVIDTNITWQVGHLLMSYYYHTVLVIEGPQRDLYESIPFRTYSDFYSRKKAAESIGEVSPQELLKQLKIMEQRSLKIIKNLPEEELNNQLVPTKFPHPIAKTKLEALNWNIQHTMWHCGQLAILVRILDKGLTF